MRDLERLKTIQAVVDRELRAVQVAERLGMSALRPAKVQQPRMRRACVGELIQIDGWEHAWFEDRGPVCTALPGGYLN
jgi:hypothetical protein